jgi:ParB-like nuclease domain
MSVAMAAKKLKAMSGQSWRDIYKVHPAADIFPMLPEDELRELGEDIKKNGLREPIILWSPKPAKDTPHQFYVLDGRNRLDAMELAGIELPHESDGVLNGWEYHSDGEQRLYGNEIDPYAFVISKNIRRRHLTKEQQADLIVKVMKADVVAGRAAELADILILKEDLARAARSFSPQSGKRGGSTKDPFKKKVVEEAEKHGISKRTAEKAIAKDRGPTQAARARKKEEAAIIADIEAKAKTGGTQRQAVNHGAV